MDEENIHINSIYFVQFNKMARHIFLFKTFTPS